MFCMTEVHNPLPAKTVGKSGPKFRPVIVMEVLVTREQPKMLIALVLVQVGLNKPVTFGAMKHHKPQQNASRE